MSKKENYNKRKALKVCIQCGKQDERTMQGYILCNVCNDKRRDKFYQKAKYYQRRELFLCVHCGKQDDRTLQGHIVTFGRSRITLTSKRKPSQLTSVNN